MKKCKDCFHIDTQSLTCFACLETELAQYKKELDLMIEYILDHVICGENCPLDHEDCSYGCLSAIKNHFISKAKAKEEVLE